MKKVMSAVNPVKKDLLKSIKTSSKQGKAAGGKRPKKKNLLNEVLDFRWLKKAMVGKTQEESLDLLDEWILKKKTLSLFS
jgi:hypothetical protein